MTQPDADAPAPGDSPLTVEPPNDLPPDVSFALPPSAYDSITTEEQRFAPDEPPASRLPPSLDLTPALRAIESLSAKLDALGHAFDREVRAEATREKIVDRLHAELQDYKQDLVLSLLKPVFLDLIQLHDDVGKMAVDPKGAADSEAPAVADLLANVQQGIEDILYRQGVESFRSDQEEFDARRQRAITTVPTEDPALARRIAGRHRRGFAAGEKVIRPEVVSVFALRKG